MVRVTFGVKVRVSYLWLGNFCRVRVTFRVKVRVS